MLTRLARHVAKDITGRTVATGQPNRAGEWWRFCINDLLIAVIWTWTEMFSLMANCCNWLKRWREPARWVQLQLDSVIWTWGASPFTDDNCKSMQTSCTIYDKRALCTHMIVYYYSTVSCVLCSMKYLLTTSCYICQYVVQPVYVKHWE